MTLRTVLLTTACAGLAGLLSTGCTGVLEPLGGGGGGPDAGGAVDAPVGNGPQGLFISNVRDLLGTKCTPCHVEGGNQAPYFLAATADNYYNFLMNGYPNEWVGTSPDESDIYTKGLTPHAGNIVWAVNEQTYIYEWIQAEYADRSGGGGNPVVDPDAANCVGDPQECALENFAKCFSYTNWQTKQIYQIANVQSTTGACSLCHSDGTGGFYSSTDSLQTYQQWKTPDYVQTLVQGSLNGAQFAGLVASSIVIDKGADQNHPGYVLDTTYTDNLNGFIQDTLTAFGNGGCVDDPGQ